MVLEIIKDSKLNREVDKAILVVEGISLGEMSGSKMSSGSSREVYSRRKDRNMAGVGPSGSRL